MQHFKLITDSEIQGRLKKSFLALKNHHGPENPRPFFKKYGFLLIPNILSSDEIKLLNVDSKFLLKNVSQTLYKKDKNSKITKLINWNTSSNNEKFSLIARDERFVNIAKTILDHKTIYVYSHKITLKEPLS